MAYSDAEIEKIEKALRDNPKDKANREALIEHLEKSGNEFEANLARTGHVPLPEFDLIDECSFFDKKTKQQVNLDRKRLEKIADSHNENIESRGAAPVVCLGHTKDDAPESEQPPATGVTTRHTVKAYKPDKSGKVKFALWAKPWARQEHVETFRQNNQRSVELWLDPDAINPIALLGSTTPRRDLGLHLFSREYGAAEKTSSGQTIRFSRSNDGRQPILFEMRADMEKEKGDSGPPVKCDVPGSLPPGGAPAGPSPDPTADPSADTGGSEFLSQLFASDQWKQLLAMTSQNSEAIGKIMPIFEELEQEAMGGGGEGGAPPGSAPPGAAPPGAPPGGSPAPPDAPGGDAPQPGGTDAPGGDEPAEEEEEPPAGPNKKNMAGSAAGYANTTMPNHKYSRPAWEPDMADHEARVRMQRLEAEAATTKNQVAAMLRQQEQLVKENAALRLARIEDEVDIALNELTREGYTVVTAVDRPMLCQMAGDKRAAAIKFMRETRVCKAPEAPLPGGGKFVVDPTEIAPVKFARHDDVLGFGADPKVVAQRSPDDYGSLVAAAGDARKKGINLKNAFDVSGLTAAASNGVAVR